MTWEWANPEAFWLLALFPLWLAVYLYRRGREQAPLTFSHLPAEWRESRGGDQWWMHTGNAFLAISLIPLVLALARPQTSMSKQKVNTEGVDILLALDISTSMLALDFQPNRLEAAKNHARQFIEGRKNDRIGLVVFAGESFSQCPLTSDQEVLIRQLEKVFVGALEDGTAIGLGLATAVDRLKESQATSKVVVLLTDGVNNSGFIDPQTSAEIAREYGIKVYTIGVGSQGTAPYPTRSLPGKGRFGNFQRMKVEIDEALLQEIARQTGGRYFRATDNENLAAVYREIDQLEKTVIEVSNVVRYREEYRPLLELFAGMLCLALMIKFVLLRTLT